MNSKEKQESIGEGWVRHFFDFEGRPTYISYPVFESQITPGRMIDMKNGVWESGNYTGRKVKAIFMPTLNNHGYGNSDYAGITGAIKSFLGTTEIIGGGNDTVNYNGRGFYNYHGATVGRGNSGAQYLGRVKRYLIKET